MIPDAGLTERKADVVRPADSCGKGRILLGDCPSCATKNFLIIHFGARAGGVSGSRKLYLAPAIFVEGGMSTQSPSARMLSPDAILRSALRRIMPSGH